MRLLRALTPLVVGVALAVCAPGALAAYPGANGMLVVAPLHGPGLELVDARGHSQQLICTAASLCGSPGAPHFSRDGQELVFANRRTGQPVVVATDGTCLWCLLGAPLTKRTGTGWAFAPNGRVSVNTPAGVWTVPLGSGVAKQAVVGPDGSAAWSPSGAVAFVRDGLIWLRRLRRAPRPIAPGTTPTFSPDAKRLAFASLGWIWVVNVSGGVPHHLVRGSDPAYSPDGRSLAFIGRASQVYVVGARGGKPHPVHGVRGWAIDWQPLPTGAAGRCRVPSGATVVAQTGEAVVTYDPANALSPWTGCLQATGTSTPLVTLPSTPANNSLGQVQLSGRFVAFVLNTTDQASNCTNGVRAVDLGFGTSVSLYTQDCSATARGVDSLGVDSSGFTAWRSHEQVATAQPLTGIACPSSSLCVASDGHGNVATSSSPASAGSWSLHRVAGTLNNVVCPSTSFCLGIDGGAIVTSTNPASGAWNPPVTIDPSGQLADVSCAPASAVCVAVDNAGNVLSSTNPTGGPSAWRVVNITGPFFLTGVSCPSSHLCVAVGQDGAVFTSTNPTANDALAWSHSTAESVTELTGVSCPTTTFCLAADSAGNVLKKNPTTTGPWIPHAVPGESSFLYQPVCTSVSLCLVRDGSGNVIVSSNPQATSPTWTATPLGATLTGLACGATGSTTLCAASDSAGQVHVSSNPSSATPAWSTTAIDVPPCAPCIAEQLYAHDDRATQALDAVQPGAGNVISNVSLGANSTQVTWQHGVTRHSYRLK